MSNQDNDAGAFDNERADFRQAVHDLYVEHAGTATGYLINSGCPKDDAEAIVHDAFLIIQEKWPPPRDDDMRPHILRIVHYLWLNEWRRTRTRRRLTVAGSPDDHAHDLPTPARGHADDVVDWAVLRLALAELSEQYRQVVVLRTVFDLSVADTARVLGIPEGTVKIRLLRGLAKLEDILNEGKEETEQ